MHTRNPTAAARCPRVPIITALRIATILVLTQRTATGGIAPLLLYRAATPGWRGAAADWLRVVAGDEEPEGRAMLARRLGCYQGQLALL